MATVRGARHRTPAGPVRAPRRTEQEALLETNAPPPVVTTPSSLPTAAAVNQEPVGPAAMETDIATNPIATRVPDLNTVGVAPPGALQLAPADPEGVMLEELIDEAGHAVIVPSTWEEGVPKELMQVETQRVQDLHVENIRSTIQEGTETRQLRAGDQGPNGSNEEEVFVDQSAATNPSATIDNSVHDGGAVPVNELGGYDNCPICCCEMDDPHDMAYNRKCSHRIHLGCCRMLLSVSPVTGIQTVRYQFHRTGQYPQCKVYPENW
jgi:hypothetical protein